MWAPRGEEYVLFIRTPPLRSAPQPIFDNQQFLFLSPCFAPMNFEECEKIDFSQYSFRKQPNSGNEMERKTRDIEISK